LLTVISLVGVASAHAADAIRQENVHSRNGTSAATIKGRLPGDQIVECRVRASAGQTLVVALQKSNPKS